MLSIMFFISEILVVTNPVTFKSQILPLIKCRNHQKYHFLYQGDGGLVQTGMYILLYTSLVQIIIPSWDDFFIFGFFQVDGGSPRKKLKKDPDPK